MILYIVRHAWAGQHGDPQYPDDSLRPLTEKGDKRFRRVAKRLVKLGVRPTLIATSPLLRCRQTADIMAQAQKIDVPVVESQALAPGSDLDAVIEWTRQQTAETIAWVGHAPDVDKMASELIGGGEPRFSKGAVAEIAFADQIAVGQGELRWLVTAKLLGR